jgi:hypothetical protein
MGKIDLAGLRHVMAECERSGQLLAATVFQTRHRNASALQLMDRAARFDRMVLPLVAHKNNADHAAVVCPPQQLVDLAGAEQTCLIEGHSRGSHPKQLWFVDESTGTLRGRLALHRAGRVLFRAKRMHKRDAPRANSAV